MHLVKLALNVIINKSLCIDAGTLYKKINNIVELSKAIY